VPLGQRTRTAAIVKPANQNNCRNSDGLLGLIRDAADSTSHLAFEVSL
jgi:hypothetical protein